MLQYANESEYYYIDCGQVTRREYIEAMLDAVGKAIFAKYYWEFRREDVSMYYVIEENYSEYSKKKRTSYAVSLFRQGLAKEALEIVGKARRIDPVLSAHARALYFCEFGEEIEI